MMPSPETLARCYRGIQDRDFVIQAHELTLAPDSPARREHRRASGLARDRNRALASLALTLPGRTVQDAIAQLGFAMGTLETLDERVREGLGWEGRLELDDLARALASVLAVTTELSGEPAAGLVEAWCLDQHRAHFGILDGPAAEEGA